MTQIIAGGPAPSLSHTFSAYHTLSHLRLSFFPLAENNLERRIQISGRADQRPSTHHWSACAGLIISPVVDRKSSRLSWDRCPHHISSHFGKAISVAVFQSANRSVVSVSRQLVGRWWILDHRSICHWRPRSTSRGSYLDPRHPVIASHILPRSQGGFH